MNFRRAQPHISSVELFSAQLALYVAMGLQVIAWSINGNATFGLHPLIICSEIVLSLVLGFSAARPQILTRTLYRAFSFVLLGLVSAENISSLIIVLRQLITPGIHLSGYELLTAAIAIFLTNIIVFALWYWEIDSPGLSGKKWSRYDKDFQFTQQDLTDEFPDWHPKFADYMYLSVTNAINFAPADTKPLTSQAKTLMGTQALVSVFTLALVVARSVSILG